MPDLHYQVDLASSARRELRALAKDVLARVFGVIEGLATNPRPAGSKKLINHFSAWRVRIGDYRIVYTIDDKQKIVEVIRIGHRGEVYR